MRALIVSVAVLCSAPAFAEPITYPVTIPQECFELAQREGVPTVIENKYQAAKARLKLANLKNSDHLVRECRAAVARAKRSREQSDQYR
jgi:hypothetical protein